MSNYKLHRAEKREGPAYWLLAYIRWSTRNGFMKISHERTARTIVVAGLKQRRPDAKARSRANVIFK